MRREEIKLEVYTVIKSLCLKDDAVSMAIREEMRLQDLGFDSIDIVDVCVGLDEALSIDTDYDRVVAMETVGEVIDYVEELVSVKV